ncbi:OmpA family protein [Vibrio metschnikovii]|uniref:OmpA family protein n=1 Tax=Vibrio metschnikovii TaxID=28172 RepID=UPI00164B30EA|nr:OmpA family protein [Vibrio metschnikovii]MBC5830880.1 OmpA family protein [Vibrio metschnikovii]
MRKIILLVSILNVPVLSASEPPRFFIGAKQGYQWAIDKAYDHSNPKGAIFGVYSGLQFSPSWRWDVGYQHHDTLKIAEAVNIRTWLIESALRYDWYLEDNLSLYGRLGGAYWDMEKTERYSNNSDATGFSPLGEIGVNYNFSPSVRLSAGYQHINGIGKSNTGKYDSHGFLVGLTYTFGHAGNATQPVLVETASTSKVSPSPTHEVAAEDSAHQTHSFLAEVEEHYRSDAVVQTTQSTLDETDSTPTVVTPPHYEATADDAYDFSDQTTKGWFDFDSIELSDDFIGLLADVASVLNTDSHAQAIVVGHADSTGPASYNQKLSEQRAQAVVDKLMEFNVTPTQVEWRGQGESQPIADNNTAEGRAKNRRVEVTLPNFQSQK